MDDPASTPPAPTPSDIAEVPPWEQWLELVPWERWGFTAGAGAASAILPIVIGLLMAAAAYALIASVFALLVWLPYRRLPRRDRLIFGVSIWLTVVPVLGLLWNFRVVAKVPASFRRYFERHPDAVASVSVGDGGRGLGLGYAICAVLGVLAPFTCVFSALAFPALIASLVLYILFVAKLFGLADLVRDQRRRDTVPDSQPAPAIA